MHKNSKFLLYIVLVLVASLYAAPNLYPSLPALQLASRDVSNQISNADANSVSQKLQEVGISEFEIDTSKGSFNIIFQDSQVRNDARQVLAENYSEFVIALSEISTAPEWFEEIGASKLNLGLDLSGGVHFLLQIDTAPLIDTRLEAVINSLSDALAERSDKVFVRTEIQGDLVRVMYKDEDVDAVLEELNQLPQLVSRRTSYGSELQFHPEALRMMIDDAVNQNLSAIRKRVNELGLSEPIVQKQGRERIVVELPGVQDSAAAKRIIGKTATLEFRLELDADAPSYQGKRFRFKDRGGVAILERDTVLTGTNVTNAQSRFDSETGQPIVSIEVDSEGGRKIQRISSQNLGRRMAVLLIEERVDTQGVREKVAEIISFPSISGVLGIQFQIEGLGSPVEASELALLLRAGALAAPMSFVEERTIGPSLGEENIQLGMRALAISLLLVIVFMIAVYKGFGVVSVIALTSNMVLLTALLSLLGATLTLPGIAGLVLTLGMAVDANVLIFSRVKEELAEAETPYLAIETGFNRAFLTIIDANITTLIAAVILYAIGTGPIKGFAVTLSLGIISSIISAVFGTRSMLKSFTRIDANKLWL